MALSLPPVKSSAFCAIFPVKYPFCHSASVEKATLTSSLRTPDFQKHQASHLVAAQSLSRGIKARQASPEKSPSSLDVKHRLPCRYCQRSGTKRNELVPRILFRTVRSDGCLTSR